eukprot:scaffold921_cov397-Prasinococcus_capsulatus_cf.AAC.16
MSDAQHLHRYSGDSEHNTINGVGNSSGIGSAIVYPELERVLQGAARATEEDLWHPKHYSTNLPDPALVLFCYSRPEYLASTLESLAHVDQIGSLSIYIAQDGNNPRVRQVGSRIARAPTKVLESMTGRGYPGSLRCTGKDQKGHAYVAQNYRFSLDRIFKKVSVGSGPVAPCEYCIGSLAVSEWPRILSGNCPSARVRSVGKPGTDSLGGSVALDTLFEVFVAGGEPSDPGHKLMERSRIEVLHQ